MYIITGERKWATVNSIGHSNNKLSDPDIV